jgi:hypothetical protein
MFENLLGKGSKRANVNYVGKDGITRSCKKALQRVIETQGNPEEAIVIAHDTSRGFLLLGDDLDVDTVVMAGFGAGYPGEGPDGFAWAKEFLAERNVSLSEVAVDAAFMHRLSERDLRERDIALLKGEE